MGKSILRTKMGVGLVLGCLGVILGGESSAFSLSFCLFFPFFFLAFLLLAEHMSLARVGEHESRD